MLIGAVMFLTSAFGSGLAFGVWDLTFWRLIGGIGIGIASVVAPAYIAEVAPRQIRGTLGSLQQLAITLGIFAALLSDALAARRSRCGSDSTHGDGCCWSKPSRLSCTASWR